MAAVTPVINSGNHNNSTTSTTNGSTPEQSLPNQATNIDPNVNAKSMADVNSATKTAAAQAIPMAVGDGAAALPNVALAKQSSDIIPTENTNVDCNTKKNNHEEEMTLQEMAEIGKLLETNCVQSTLIKKLLVQNNKLREYNENLKKRQSNLPEMLNSICSNPGLSYGDRYAVISQIHNYAQSELAKLSVAMILENVNQDLWQNTVSISFDDAMSLTFIKAFSESLHGAAGGIEVLNDPKELRLLKAQLFEDDNLSDKAGKYLKCMRWIHIDAFGRCEVYPSQTAYELKKVTIKDNEAIQALQAAQTKYTTARLAYQDALTKFETDKKIAEAAFPDAKESAEKMALENELQSAADRLRKMETSMKEAKATEEAFCIKQNIIAIQVDVIHGKDQLVRAKYQLIQFQELLEKFEEERVSAKVASDNAQIEVALAKQKKGVECFVDQAKLSAEVMPQETAAHVAGEIIKAKGITAHNATEVIKAHDLVIIHLHEIINAIENSINALQELSDAGGKITNEVMRVQAMVDLRVGEDGLSHHIRACINKLRDDYCYFEKRKVSDEAIKHASIKISEAHNALEAVDIKKALAHVLSNNVKVLENLHKIKNEFELVKINAKNAEKMLANAKEASDKIAAESTHKNALKKVLDTELAFKIAVDQNLLGLKIEQVLSEDYTLSDERLKRIEGDLQQDLIANEKTASLEMAKAKKASELVKMSGATCEIILSMEVVEKGQAAIQAEIKRQCEAAMVSNRQALGKAAEDAMSLLNNSQQSLMKVQAFIKLTSWVKTARKNFPKLILEAAEVEMFASKALNESASVKSIVTKAIQDLNAAKELAKTAVDNSAIANANAAITDKTALLRIVELSAASKECIAHILLEDAKARRENVHATAAALIAIEKLINLIDKKGEKEVVADTIDAALRDAKQTQALATKIIPNTKSGISIMRRVVTRAIKQYGIADRANQAWVAVQKEYNKSVIDVNKARSTAHAAEMKREETRKKTYEVIKATTAAKDAADQVRIEGCDAGTAPATIAIKAALIKDTMSKVSICAANCAAAIIAIKAAYEEDKIAKELEAKARSVWDKIALAKKEKEKADIEVKWTINMARNNIEIVTKQLLLSTPDIELKALLMRRLAALGDPEVTEQQKTKSDIVSKVGSAGSANAAGSGGAAAVTVAAGFTPQFGGQPVNQNHQAQAAAGLTAASVTAPVAGTSLRYFGK